MILSLIHILLRLYIYIIIFDVIMSYMPQLKGQKWAQFIHKMADASLRPIREALPQNMPFDPSPLIVVLLIQMLMYLL